jgi:predicted dehydrogenase
MDPSADSLAVLLRYPATENSEHEKPFVPKRRIETSPVAVANETELRVALVGAGNLARWAHLPNIKKIPGVKLHAVYSSSGSRGKSYALRFGAAYSCSDFDEVLRDPNVDIVLVASRHQHHASQALASLRAGKHVFLEKPMALTEAECQQLYRAVEETGRQLTVGFNRRFAPFYIELKKALARRSGPAVVSVRMNSPGLSGSFWAADPAIGGAILGEACHFIDLMYWLLESEPTKVSAYSLPLGTNEPIGENNIVASFQFADGSIGNLTYCTVGTKTSGGERVEVFAPGISATTEDMKRLTVNAKLRRTRNAWWAEKGYAAQMESFVNGIRKGKAPEVTVRDGARATIGGLRMLESARTMRPCEFDIDAVIS